MIKSKKIQDRVQEKEDSADKQISIYKLPGTKTKLDVYINHDKKRRRKKKNNVTN